VCLHSIGDAGVCESRGLLSSQNLAEVLWISNAKQVLCVYYQRKISIGKPVYCINC
jgi:hypothetical protein